METIHILVVEDEAILAMDLAQRLGDLGYYVVDTVDNGPQALEIVRQQPIDLILMDIHIMGEWDGIETIRRMQTTHSIPFIFLTAMTDATTIERARQVSPSAYITKPFNDLNLRIAIDLAIHNFAARLPADRPHTMDTAAPESLLKNEALLLVKDYYFIKQNYRFIKFQLQDVLFLQSDGNYTDIVTREGKYTLRVVMSKVIEKMQAPDIVRVHRSYAINRRVIDGFGESEIIIGKHTLPIGRSYREEFMKGLELM
ncbi:response regulator [Fibrella sp. HMF5335]|uniref:Response regulator n=1 Tax=Fibrella rubiginis TaxID=2817060 RepID=A0A939K592_9BACT|nr:response regulator [Fibrella rubiginis]MBO0936220.1 response regulator [Fibrella rubiginis]